jgi:hypothetical protein
LTWRRMRWARRWVDSFEAMFYFLAFISRGPSCAVGFASRD